MTNFAAPVFGIKAKLLARNRIHRADFAAPVFGIKAKRVLDLRVQCVHFAAPVFGIKAKLDDEPNDGEDDFAAPVLESTQSVIGRLTHVPRETPAGNRESLRRFTPFFEVSPKKVIHMDSQCPTPAFIVVA